MGYLIKVEGEIIAKEKNHIAQNWACAGVGQEPSKKTEFLFDEETHTVKSDLVLDENIRAIPYAIYYTEKGIRSEHAKALITADSGYGPALLYYNENIEEIKKILQININKEIESSFYRGLFIDVFSILELFLSDVLLCLIYHNNGIYKNALKFFGEKRNKNIQIINRELERKVHNYFFKEIVYHKFNFVEKMFKEILNIDIPNYTQLSNCLHKRNNIVHRYSLSGIDRMKVSIINKKDVENLISTTNDFVNKLAISIQSALKN